MTYTTTKTSMWEVESIKKDNDMSLSDRDLAESDVLRRSHRRLVQPVDERMVHVTTVLPGDSSFSPLTCSVSTFHFLSPDRVLFPEQVTAPFLHMGGVMLMTALAWPVASYFFRMNSRGKRCLVVPPATSRGSVISVKR